VFEDEDYDFDLDDLMDDEGDDDLSMGGGLSHGLPRLADSGVSSLQPMPLPPRMPETPDPEPAPEHMTTTARQVMREFIDELAKPKPASPFSQIAEAYFGTRAMSNPHDPMAAYYFKTKEHRDKIEQAKRAEMVSLVKAAADEERRNMEFEIKIAKHRQEDEDRKDVDLGEFLGDKRFRGMMMPRGAARSLQSAIVKDTLGNTLDPLQQQRLTNDQTRGDILGEQLRKLRDPASRFEDPTEQLKLQGLQYRTEASRLSMERAKAKLAGDHDGGDGMDELKASQRENAIRQIINSRLVQDVGTGPDRTRKVMVPPDPIKGGKGAWKDADTLTEDDWQRIHEWAESILAMELPPTAEPAGPGLSGLRGMLGEP
jgi:hypothetical protein